MKKSTIAISLILLLISLCACSFSNSIEDYARDYVNSCSKQNYQAAAKNFDDSFKEKMTIERIQDIWEYFTSQYGEFVEISSASASKSGQSDVITLNVIFKNGKAKFNLTFDSNKKIINFTSEDVIFDIAPKAPANVKEQELKIGAQTNWELGATLNYFGDKTTNVTAVVLVGGSGAMNRNETISNQSLFRDIAWGLSERGIAVLRYDKRTFAHAEKIAAEAFSTLTVNEETIDDAVLAVKALKEQSTVKINKIYIIGHSLGASMLPRIAKQAPDVAGYVYMSAFARPLEDLVLDQNIYLSKQNKSLTQQQKDQAIDSIKKQIENIKSLTADSNFEPDELLGSPKSYWLDLKDYNPVIAAQQINKPMLFLQGEKDYQVTMTDFNIFKDTLNSKWGVKFISYPSLNYMYTESSGETALPSDYHEYKTANQKVINDIYDFIK